MKLLKNYILLELHDIEVMEKYFKKDNIPRLVNRFIKVYPAPDDEPLSLFYYFLCDVETGLIYTPLGEKEICSDHRTQVKYNLDTHNFYCLEAFEE